MDVITEDINEDTPWVMLKFKNLSCKCSIYIKSPPVYAFIHMKRKIWQQIEEIPEGLGSNTLYVLRLSTFQDDHKTTGTVAYFQQVPWLVSFNLCSPLRRFIEG